MSASINVEGLFEYVFLTYLIEIGNLDTEQGESLSQVLTHEDSRFAVLLLQEELVCNQQQEKKKTLI